jgi:peroxiredoxin Q/BCP
MKATDFKLEDSNGVAHSLEDYKGKWLVLYFYPKDDTPGCTIEACSFRDNLDLLRKAGVEVLGVSKDSVKSHEKFTKKYGLNFPVLSDENKETIKAYGAWGTKKFMGKEFEGVIRKTFIIDDTGEIRKTYDKVTPSGHADEILKDIQNLKAT